MARPSSEVICSPTFIRSLKKIAKDIDKQKMMDQVNDLLLSNMFSGNLIPKRLTSRFTNQSGITNLYSLKLDKGFRLLYTIGRSDDKPVPVLLDILPRKSLYIETKVEPVTPIEPESPELTQVISPKPPESEKYGFIAYFDILGFSELIKEENFADKIQLYNEILQEAVSSKNRDLDYIFFSDSVIINSNNSSEQDLLNLCVAIAEIMFRLLMELDLTICGCISFGEFTKLTNNGNAMITGTPILDAVKFEELQKWVGMMLSPRVVKAFRTIGPKTNMSRGRAETFPALFEENLPWKIHLQRYSPIPLADGTMDGFVIIPRDPSVTDCMAHIDRLKDCRQKLDELCLFAPDPYSQQKYITTNTMLREIIERWETLSSQKLVPILKKSSLN